jgi:hypothetical protein
MLTDTKCACSEAKTQATSKSVLSAVVLEGIDLACGVAAAEKISDYCNPKGQSLAVPHATVAQALRICR